MSGPDDDSVPPRRGAVPPPRSLAPEDAPEDIEVPRMEPPPPSLEAMVQPRLKRPRRRPPEPQWWPWVIGLLLVIAGVAMLLR